MSNENPKIYEAMSNVMLDIKAVSKNKTNKMQGFNFRGIDDMYNACNLAMAKNKVFSTSKVLSSERFERKTAKGGILNCISANIQFTFHGVDGSSVSTEVMSEAMDSGDKAAPKIMSIAHKYALIQCFMIPTDQSVDADKDSYIMEQKPRINDKQAKAINDKVEEYQIPVAGFQKWLNNNLKVSSVVAIPEDCYDQVMMLVESKKPVDEKEVAQ